MAERKSERPSVSEVAAARLAGFLPFKSFPAWHTRDSGRQALVEDFALTAGTTAVECEAARRRVDTLGAVAAAAGDCLLEDEAA